MSTELGQLTERFASALSPHPSPVAVVGQTLGCVAYSRVGRLGTGAAGVLQDSYIHTPAAALKYTHGHKTIVICKQSRQRHARESANTPMQTMLIQGS
jgi:hypothetical protein